MSFTSIPVLDLDLARDAATKPEFLIQLRHALLEVGFLYLKNVGIPRELVQEVIDKGKAFFDAPLEDKCVDPAGRRLVELALSYAWQVED